jgi:hypothetical protein
MSFGSRRNQPAHKRRDRTGAMPLLLRRSIA